MKISNVNIETNLWTAQSKCKLLMKWAVSSRNTFSLLKIYGLIIRVCTMRPFFLNFLADTLKSCEMSLTVGKNTFFIISIIFQVAPPIFWALKSPKMRKYPYLNNRWSYEVLWPLILTGTCMFLTTFTYIIPLKWTKVLQNRKNGKNRLKWCKIVCKV